MDIIYKGRPRSVKDSVGRALIKIGKATSAEKSQPVPAYETRAVQAEEISERTGKPKRKYKRRDLQAEG